ncbi:hypothetical protein CC80DRAFT_595552 [Byssothecium circinans]|uniref:DUF3074 domain-containing protein n=1 Tax=Byssothecium circinans TaxID=147558 RepID=A0A6A5TNM5_9PLEO|nr:hypothetical protein CC80DRAFT_595552 [Byssothecium circinans]
MTGERSGNAAPASAGEEAGGVSSRAQNTAKKILTLEPFGPDDIPPHPDFQSQQTDPPPLHTFLNAVFIEAEKELAVPRTNIGKFKGSVSGTPVAVEKWKSSEKIDGGDEIVWFGRTSEHEEGKLVTFKELDACLMKGHEKHEAEYTPAVYDVNTLVEWDFGGEEMVWRAGEREGKMKDVEMRITQMHHSLPGAGLLSDRLFTTLLLSFTNTSPTSTSPTTTILEAINMQIPINFPALPATIGSRAHIRLHPSSKKYIYHNDDANATSTQKQKTKAGKDIVEGKYVSVERIRLLGEEGKGRKVVWEMKTASEAGGKLPAWMQKMGVPGAIVKDVPLALGFIVEGRK